MLPQYVLEATQQDPLWHWSESMLVDLINYYLDRVCNKCDTKGGTPTPNQSETHIFVNDPCSTSNRGWAWPGNLLPMLLPTGWLIAQVRGRITWKRLSCFRQYVLKLMTRKRLWNYVMYTSGLLWRTLLFTVLWLEQGQIDHDLISPHMFKTYLRFPPPKKPKKNKTKTKQTKTMPDEQKVLGFVVW